MSAENVSVRYRFEAGRRGAAGRPACGRSAATAGASAPVGPVGTATAVTTASVPTSAGTSVSPAAPTEHPGRIPRVTRLVALAHRFQGLLARGEVQSMADLARLGGVTRARITQIMDLLLLAPDIQEALLFLPPVKSAHDPIHLRELRYVEPGARVGALGSRGAVAWRQAVAESPSWRKKETRTTQNNSSVASRVSGSDVPPDCRFSRPLTPLPEIFSRALTPLS
jgi:hypothetical protein